MKNKWSYGYIIRDADGVARIEAEGYETQQAAEAASKDALESMPEDYSVEIRYASPVYEPETPEVLKNLFWQPEEFIPPGTVIH